MKIPNTFRPEKNLQKNLEDLMSKTAYDKRKIKRFLQSSEEFIRMYNQTSDLTSIYTKSLKLADKLKYELKDVEVFSQVVEEQVLGLYLTALAQNMIKEDDKVIFKPNMMLNWLGTFWKKGTLVIENDVDTNVGSFMEGGNIIVFGNAQDSAGTLMKGGELKIYGCVQNHLGDRMSGGKIVVTQNAGDRVGQYMKGGLLIVEEDAGRLAGFEMKNGEIRVGIKAGQSLGFNMSGGKIIAGNTDDYAGWAMHGGEIIIEGNSGDMTGCQMKKGKITVNGTIKSIDVMDCKGQIYNQGKKVWPIEKCPLYVNGIGWC